MENVLTCVDVDGNETVFNPEKIENFKPESRTSKLIDFNNLVFFCTPSIDGPKRKPYILIEINLTPGIIPSNKNVIIFRIKPFLL